MIFLSIKASHQSWARRLIEKVSLMSFISARWCISLDPGWNQSFSIWGICRLISLCIAFKKLSVQLFPSWLTILLFYQISFGVCLPFLPKLRVTAFRKLIHLSSIEISQPFIVLSERVNETNIWGRKTFIFRGEKNVYCWKKKKTNTVRFQYRNTVGNKWSWQLQFQQWIFALVLACEPIVPDQHHA